MTITRFELLESSGQLVVEWALAYAGPTPEVSVTLPFTAAGRLLARVPSTGTATPDAVTGSEVASLDALGLGRLADAVTVSVTALAGVSPGRGCQDPGELRSASRDVVVPGTEIPRAVEAFALGQFAVQDSDFPWLRARTSVVLTGPAGSEWCSTVRWTLTTRDGEYLIGTDSRSITQEADRLEDVFEERLGRNDLPDGLPTSARNASVRATTSLFAASCAQVTAEGMQAVRRVDSDPQCVEKYPATNWQPCRR